MLRIGCDLQKCGSSDLEQEIIEDLRVVLAKRNQLVRQGENHVEITYAEQFLFAGGEPALARLRLALWAMPISARNGELTITCLMGSIF